MSETSSGTVTGRALSREMARSLAAIRREHDRLARRGRDLPPGADWLLDNWYLIEREGKLAASELRGAGRLRASGGSAVIVSACAALVRESGGAVTAERAERYLADFQRDLPLTMRELGLFAPALRLALTAEIRAAVTDGIDAAVINTNFAVEAGLIPAKDAIVIEGKDSPYANVLVVRGADKDTPAVKALVKAANSKEVKEYINKNLVPKGIVAAF